MYVDWPIRRSCAWFGAVLVCATFAGTARGGPDVDIEYVDGRTSHAELLGSSSEGLLRVMTDGTERAVAPADIVRITFRQHLHRQDSGQPDSTRPQEGDEFRLSDGSRLMGTLLRGTQDALVVNCVLADEVTVPFRLLAGARFAPDSACGSSTRLYVEALADRLPGKDVLITCGGDDARALPGRLVRLGADGGTFDFGGRERTFKRDKVFGVVFAAGPGGSSGSPAHIRLTDGSVVGGKLTTLDADGATIDTPLGVGAHLPVPMLVRVEFETDRIVYLSDLTPVATRQEGVLHDGWPVRSDKSASAGPISIDGHRFGKGIGCHSYSELTYELDRPYASFAATVGIDDHVRPRGSVVFRVLGDDKPLYDSGIITGTDGARDVLVDLTGVSRLTLIADYGDGLDLSDHADWGGARLIKRLDPPDGSAP